MKVLMIIFISAFFFMVFGDSSPQVYTTPGWVRITPYFQNLKVKGDLIQEAEFSEQSNLFSIHYSLMGNWNIGLTGAQAQVNGDVPGLDGLADVQAYTNVRLPSLNMVFGLQLNFPSGKTELNRGEFESSFAISNPIFRFRVPSFGQGLNISPSIMWVYPVKETVVVGLGASYQYLGDYTSIENTGKYNPGDEILLTAGIDFRLTPTTRMSGDIIYTNFGKDQYENKEIYAAGDKILLSLQLKRYFGYHVLQLTGLYRSRAKNNLIVQDRQVKTIPNNFDTRLNYSMRLSGQIYLNILAEMLLYEQSEAEISDGYIFGGGLIPEFRLTDYFDIQLTGRYFLGEFQNNLSLTGYEAGLGLKLNF